MESSREKSCQLRRLANLAVHSSCSYMILTSPPISPSYRKNKGKVLLPFLILFMLFSEVIGSLDRKSSGVSASSEMHSGEEPLARLLVANAKKRGQAMGPIPGHSCVFSLEYAHLNVVFHGLHGIFRYGSLNHCSSAPKKSSKQQFRAIRSCSNIKWTSLVERDAIDELVDPYSNPDERIKIFLFRGAKVIDFGHYIMLQFGRSGMA